MIEINQVNKMFYQGSKEIPALVKHLVDLINFNHLTT